MRMVAHAPFGVSGILWEAVFCYLLVCARGPFFFSSPSLLCHFFRDEVEVKARTLQFLAKLCGCTMWRAVEDQKQAETLEYLLAHAHLHMRTPSL